MEPESSDTESRKLESVSPEKLSFFKELKRRKVFRVAATYSVVAWLVIQVASTTFGGFGIPIWAFRFVVLMVLLGFPVAIVLTWAFELTPEGVKKTAAIRKSTPLKSDPSLNRKRNLLAIGFAAALPTLIFGTLALFFYVNQSPVIEEREVSADRPYVIGSVAVLPFKLISEDSGDTAIAEGLHEEILTAMSEMAPLDVVSRTSTLKYANHTEGIPQIGEDLGADYLVEGSIQRTGTRLRVTLQLVESNQDRHIWADTFDREPDSQLEFLQLQKELGFELAFNVYKALKLEHPPSGTSKEMLEAKIAELRSRYIPLQLKFWGKEGDSPSNDLDLTVFPSIIEILEESIRLDPDNPRAFNEYAMMQGNAAGNAGWENKNDLDWINRLFLILKQAQVVSPDGHDVLLGLGFFYHFSQNNPLKAIPYLRSAVKKWEENPWFANVWPYIKLADAYLDTGQTAAAIRALERAPDAPMVDRQINAWIRAFLMERRFDELDVFLSEAIARAKEKQYPNYDYLMLSNAEFQAWRNASRKPLLEEFDRPRDQPLSERDSMFLLFMAEDFDRLAVYLSSVETGTLYEEMSQFILLDYRAWAYLKAGNTALAKSYFKSLLANLDTSVEGIWMEKYQPAVFAIRKSLAHAGLGDKAQAMALIQDAFDKGDPGRNYSDYISTLYGASMSYAHLEMVDEACDMIDQLLSNPSSFTTGEMLLEPTYDKIRTTPQFEAVIRKHADQLKDPAVLDTFFDE